MEAPGSKPLASSSETDPEPGSSPRVGTYDEIARQLTDGYWEYSAARFGGYGGRRAFDVAPGGTLTADITALSPEEQQLARWALEAWTNVTGIGFRLVTGGGQITFDHDVPPGFHGTGGPTRLGPGGVTLRAGVHVSADLLADHGAAIDGYAFHVFVHEIGHALGLGHAGDYPRVSSDPGVAFPDDAKFLNDSHQVSLMSYFHQHLNTHVDASAARPVTPMIVDILAIQDLYGVPDDINAGDTIHGYGSNVGGYLGRLLAALSGEKPDAAIYAGGPVALTLHDTGGDDTLDLRWDAGDQRVDLRPEGISDVLGLTGNLVIARDTLIENFVAGSGNDAVTGNDAANRLDGRAGNDRLSGGRGDDRLAGGAGNDRLAGGAGADAMDGGPGRDLLWYAESDAGVDVDLSTGAGSGGPAEGDTFQNVEGVIGSAHADTLTGGAGNDWLAGRGGGDVLAGGGGNDNLVGGAGADAMDGGAGHDRVLYGRSAAAVRIDLSAGRGRGGDAEGDTLENVEEIVGSPHADTLTGGDGDDWLIGNAGDDVLAGGAGHDNLVGGAGADAMDGGPGHDRLWYGGSDVGVSVDLSTGTARGGDAEGDTFENVEGVGGSRHADTLTGGSGNDWLAGHAGDDVLTGGAGADRLEGGAGGDTASYAGSNAGVRVQLRSGAPTGGHAQGDVLVGIEHIEGSPHPDTLVGNGAVNRLTGGAGNDRLFGDWGDDTLEGAAGGDLLDGGGGGGHGVLRRVGCGRAGTPRHGRGYGRTRPGRHLQRHRAPRRLVPPGHADRQRRRQPAAGRRGRRPDGRRRGRRLAVVRRLGRGGGGEPRDGGGQRRSCRGRHLRQRGRHRRLGARRHAVGQQRRRHARGRRRQRRAHRWRGRRHDGRRGRARPALVSHVGCGCERQPRDRDGRRRPRRGRHHPRHREAHGLGVRRRADRRRRGQQSVGQGWRRHAGRRPRR